MGGEAIGDDSGGEVCFNFWFVMDAASGIVGGYAGKPYVIEGTDQERIDVLRRLAATDWQTVPRRELPHRFSVIVDDVTFLGQASASVVHLSNAGFFDELITAMETKLPVWTGMMPTNEKPVRASIPPNPLAVITCLAEDAQGSLVPIVGPAKVPPRVVEPTHNPLCADLYNLAMSDIARIKLWQKLLSEWSTKRRLEPGDAQALEEIIVALDNLPWPFHPAVGQVTISLDQYSNGERLQTRFWTIEFEIDEIYMTSGGTTYHPDVGGDTFSCFDWWVRLGGRPEESDSWRDHAHVVTDLAPFEAELPLLMPERPELSISASWRFQ